MSRFSLLITSSPVSTVQRSAIEFCRAVAAAEHDIDIVFFYQDGCYTANENQSPPTDESNLLKEWIALAEQYNFPLVNCATAAARRGIVALEDVDSYQVKQATMSLGFSAGGLAEFIAKSAKSDRVVQF